MIRVREAMRCSVPNAQLFSTPTVAGLAEAMSRAGPGKGAAPSIPSTGYTAEQLAAGVLCSPNQEQMLALYQVEPDSAAYNVQDAMRLHGDVDEAVLEAALAAIARRHASLRTRFVERGGELLQAVLAPYDPRAAPKLRRRSLPAEPQARDAELALLIAEPFALVGGGVPLRIYLLTEEGAQGRVLLLSAHHAIRYGSQGVQSMPMRTDSSGRCLFMLVMHVAMGQSMQLNLPALCCLRATDLCRRLTVSQ